MDNRLSLREWLGIAGFGLFVIFAAVVLGLLFLIVAPIGLAWTGAERLREAWKHRHLSRPQRRLVRLLRKKLQECEDVHRRLDVPSPLDGVFQVQSMRVRNSLVTERFNAVFGEALAILGECRRAGIGHDILRPIWDDELCWVRLHTDIEALTMAEWSERNPLSPMLGAL